MSSDRVDVRVGETFELAFEARPTAGYRWRTVLSRTAKAHLEPLGESTEAHGSRLGAPAVQRFRFRALEVGKVTLEFHYGRRWEAGATPEQRRIEVSITSP